MKKYSFCACLLIRLYHGFDLVLEEHPSGIIFCQDLGRYFIRDYTLFSGKRKEDKK